MTRQRMVICNIVKRADGHLTAAQVCERARSELGKIALATVYNNLNELVEEGIIGRICTDGRTDLYDKSSVSHGHMLCTCCGEVQDVGSASLMREFFCEKTGEDIESFNLVLRHKCKKCTEREKR